MALTVKFWSFAKEENSTIKPVATANATYNNVELKDDCSVVNPVLKLKVSMATSVYNWNYCYIQEFNRYYFIGDWIWSSGIWIAHCKVDVMASFKTEIGSQQLYVLRAYQNALGSMLYDGNIVDSTYPTTAGKATYTAYSSTNPFAGLYSGNDGTYIVGVINKTASGVQYYAFNWLGFKQFCSALFNYSSGWLAIDPTEISEELQKALVNPFQYVVSAFYLPVPVSYFSSNNIGTTTYTVQFGWWSVTIVTACRQINPGILYQFTSSITIPKHPSAYDRGAYLNLSPYSFYTLRYYPFGTLDIDSEAICNWSTLDLYTDVDICTGKAILTIAVNGKSNPIRTVESNISVPIPTASVNVDYMNLGSKSSLVMGAASAVQQLGAGSGTFLQNAKKNIGGLIENVRSGNWAEIGAGAKEVISNIATSAMAAKATAEITGQQGTYTLFDTQTLALSGRFLPVVDEDLMHRGRPLCQSRVISTCKGFVLCADADIKIACTDRELNAIKSFMETGFYYE